MYALCVPIFFRMAVLGHADMNFLSNGSSRPCRYEFFFQMAVLGHADIIFFQMAVLGHADMNFFFKWQFSAMPI